MNIAVACEGYVTGGVSLTSAQEHGMFASVLMVDAGYDVGKGSPGRWEVGTAGRQVKTGQVKIRNRL